MKIAFFADSYLPYLSGVTISASTLAKELKLLGHQVYVLAPDYPNAPKNEPGVLRFPSVSGGYPNFRLALPIVRKIPAVDILHSHSPFQAGQLARFVARKRKLPLVYSFHTLFTRYVHYAKFIPPVWAKRGLVAYLQNYCQSTNLIVAPSSMAKRALRRWRIDRPVEVVPSGVDLSLFPADQEAARRQLRQKLGIASTDLVLLYVGRLSKEKNLSFLLRAFSQIRERNIKLVLVGGGPLLKTINPELRPEIITTGEVPYPEILKYYLVGDVFVFASTSETQGLVLAEAKAAGLPVVALFAGGLVDTVRNGLDGYLLPRQETVFIEHLQRLLGDPTWRAKLAAAARQDAVERFAAKVVAKKMESVYNSLTN